MKIIFVGIHNKKGLMPLCSSTKSGKLIDRIIKVFRQAGIQTMKTNLYDACTMPFDIDKRQHTIEWYCRADPQYDDVIILLGKEVQENFNNIAGFQKTINLQHPASIWSNKNQSKYVSNAIIEIDRKLLKIHSKK